MSIWKEKPILARFRNVKDTLIEHLGIEFVEVGDDYLKAVMPLNERTRNPMGILHGGASAALAETVASGASLHCIDFDKYNCLGLEVIVNHIKQAPQGPVTGVAKPVHIGRTTHIWDVHITDPADNLISAARVMMAIIPREEVCGDSRD